MRDSRPHIKDYSVDALRAVLAQQGLPRYRADQIAAWLYGRGIEEPEAMTDLALDLRGSLAADWCFRELELVGESHSEDGTTKGELRTHDDHVVEAVLIPEETRTTLCVSTQVGCPLACSFCATGAMGFARNLSTGEIVDQVLRMGALLDEERKITNVVFMGMGEPLLNLGSVREAIRLLLHPKGFALAPRRVTVSTVGLVPKISELLESVPVNLAVSLHATTDAVRDVLVPMNRRYPLDLLMRTLRGLELVTPRRPVFFEYTLIDGVNDSLADARRLVELLRGLPSKLNLIPMNPHPAAPYRAPSDRVTERFLAETVRGGLTVTLRRSRGADIAAACGQLAGRHGGPSRVKTRSAEAEAATGV